jgi:hypothetical protein
VIEALREARVVLIHGPRQAGKSTLLRQVAGARGGRVVDLDDERNLAAVLEDPHAFVEGKDLLAIDEFQRGGDRLLRAIKMRVDRDGTPGRFLLAGSTHFLTLPGLSESLAGRVVILDLWPLAQGEIRGGPDALASRLFEPTPILRALQPERLRRGDYYEAICRGGFPEAVSASPEGRGRWFDGYLRTVLERDLPQVAEVRHDMRRVAGLLAARTGTIPNAAEMARDLRLSSPTIAEDFARLATVFFHFTVPAFGRNLSAKWVRGAKIYMTDAGLAAHLNDQSPETLLDVTSRAAGPLLETFVAGELARQIARNPRAPALRHFRDRAGLEVDLLLEARDGRVAAVEVKASLSPGARDIRALRWLREKLGKDFVNGVLLYTGDEVLPFGDRLTALPVSALWAR